MCIGNPFGRREEGSIFDRLVFAVVINNQHDICALVDDIKNSQSLLEEFLGDYRYAQLDVQAMLVGVDEILYGIFFDL